MGERKKIFDITKVGKEKLNMTKFTRRLGKGIIVFIVLFIFQIYPVVSLWNSYKVEAQELSLVPQSQELTLKEYNLTIDASWSIVANLSSEDDCFAAQQLQENLNINYNLLLSIVNTDSISGDKYIVLANPSQDISMQALCSQRSLIPDSQLGEEGYLLEVFSDNMIIISSNFPKGVFYGMQTLKQLLSSTNNIVTAEAVKIRDWPDNKMRGMHFCGVNFDDTHEDYVYDKIDKMATYKMNTAMFETEWWYNLNEGGRRNTLQGLFNYCRKCHIEPIPEVQGGGVSYTLFEIDPHVAEGLWVQDEQFKFVNNVAEPVIPDIFVENSGFETEDNGGGKPAGWDLGAYWSWDSSNAHSGTYSVRVDISGLNDGVSGWMSSPVLIASPSTYYSLTFWAKINNTGGTYSPAIRVRELDANGEQLLSPGGGWIQHHCSLDSSAGWEEWDEGHLNFKTQSNCAKIQIYANIYRGYGTAWFDDISLKRMNGSLTNVIRTDSSDIVITNLYKTTTYLEGIDYNVTDGEMSYPYRPDHVSTRITRIETGNIAEGETVLIEYDFVVHIARKAWWSHPCCFSEPRTYNLMFKVLTDVINDEVFKPKFINIGHGEIRGMNRDSRSQKRNISNAGLLAEDINKLNDYIHTIDPNIRMMMWDDMLNPWHNGGKEDYQVQYYGPPGKTSGATDLISTDIIPLIWWYSYNESYDPNDDKMNYSPEYFKSKGFDYLVSPWYDEEYIRKWADILRERKDGLGMIDTAWPDSPAGLKWSGLKPSAAYSWCLTPKPFIVVNTPLEINIVGNKICIDTDISTEINIEKVTLYYKKKTESDDKYKVIVQELTVPLSTYKFKGWIPGEIVTTDGIKFYFKISCSGGIAEKESFPYIIDIIPSVTKIIGPEGGSIVLVDGNPDNGESCIEIPVEALEKDTSITFKQKDISDVPQGFGAAPLSAYEILPENIKFKKSYNLTLLYFDFTDEFKLDGTPILEEELQILWWDGFEWRLVGGKVDKDLNTVKRSLIHTSLFALFPAQINNFTYRPREKIITPACKDGKNDYAYFDGLTDMDSVSIKIYDITGKKVRTIDSAPYRWDGKNDDGDVVESGVYIYQYKYNGKEMNGVIAVAK